LLGGGVGRWQGLLGGLGRRGAPLRPTPGRDRVPGKVRRPRRRREGRGTNVLATRAGGGRCDVARPVQCSRRPRAESRTRLGRPAAKAERRTRRRLGRHIRALSQPASTPKASGSTPSHSATATLVASTGESRFFASCLSQARRSALPLHTPFYERAGRMAVPGCPRTEGRPTASEKVTREPSCLNLTDGPVIGTAFSGTGYPQPAKPPTRGRKPGGSLVRDRAGCVRCPHSRQMERFGPLRPHDG